MRTWATLVLTVAVGCERPRPHVSSGTPAAALARGTKLVETATEQLREADLSRAAPTQDSILSLHRFDGEAYYDVASVAELFAVALPNHHMPRRFVVMDRRGRELGVEPQWMDVDDELRPLDRRSRRTESGRLLAVFPGPRTSSVLRIDIDGRVVELAEQGTLHFGPLPHFQVHEHAQVHLGGSAWIVLRVRATHAADFECPLDLASNPTDVNDTWKQPLRCVAVNENDEVVTEPGVRTRELIACAPESRPDYDYMENGEPVRVRLPARVAHSTVTDGAILTCSRSR